MKPRANFRTLTLVSVFALTNCGGGKPKVEKPEPSLQSAAAEPTPAPEPEPAPGPAAESSTEERPPARKTAKHVVTQSGNSFALSFTDSDLGNAKREACDKKARHDAEQRQDCVAKAETEIANEGIRFEQDDKGNWWWIAFTRTKGHEIVNTKVQVKFASETLDKLTLTLEGRDVGKKPMRQLPPEIVVEVPDDHTIVMIDPKRGKLVFKSK